MKTGKTLKTIILESQIRAVIRRVLLEQDDPSDTPVEFDPNMTYYWNDFPEMINKLELPEYRQHGSQAFAPGFTKYRYSYTPATGEIKTILPSEKIVRKDTNAYKAIMKQFNEFKGEIVNFSNDWMPSDSIPVPDIEKANRLARRILLVIHGIYDSLEKFLDLGLDGAYGPDIQARLQIAYPSDNAIVSNFNRSVIDKLKSGYPLVGSVGGQVSFEDIRGIVGAPKLPVNPGRFSNLTAFIDLLRKFIVDSETSMMRVNADTISKTISIAPNPDVQKMATQVSEEINAGLKELYDFFNSESIDTRAALGGATPTSSDIEEAKRVISHTLDALSLAA